MENGRKRKREKLEALRHSCQTPPPLTLPFLHTTCSMQPGIEIRVHARTHTLITRETRLKCGTDQKFRTKMICATQYAVNDSEFETLEHNRIQILQYI
jgi:hypothetical protein